MKCNVIKVVIGIFMLVLTGCGGGGSAASSASNETSNSLITSVGWLYDNAAPDYSNSGTTCFLNVKLYYIDSIAAADIDSFSVTSPDGWQWTIASSDSQLGASSSGKPYIGGTIYYGANPYSMPLAGSWVFQLKLKNGQISSVKKILHELGSSADATHQYLYSKEDWTPSTNASQYSAALGRFPAQGFTLQYSAANGGTITTTGLSAVRTSFLAAEPRAYNMVCWLYDYKKNYIGYTITEYTPQDHSRTNLITADGELSIVTASTVSSTGQINPSAVKYLRFIYLDGAQYEPSSYSNSDYRSISSLVAVSGTTTDLVAIAVSPTNTTLPQNASQQYTAMGSFSDNTVQDITSFVTWSSSDPNVTTVSNTAGSQGKAFTVASGVSTITASSGAISNSTILTVNKWTVRATDATDPLDAAVWSGTKFVAVGWFGKIITSLDGLTWTSRTSNTSAELDGVVWSGTQFVAVGDSGTIVTSPDGVIWTKRNSGTSSLLFGVAWSGSKFVATGQNGTILSSPDGVAWTSQQSGTSLWLNRVAWSGAQFVAVGGAGTILTSPDGITWTSRTSGTSRDIYGIVWSGTQFVAVGGYTTVLTSPNGVTWTQQNPSTTNNLYRVDWTGTEFVAVGGYHYIFTSPDGVSWSSQESGTGGWLEDVASSGNVTIILQSDGSILRYGGGTP